MLDWGTWLIWVLAVVISFAVREYLGMRSNEDELNTLSHWVKRLRRSGGALASVALAGVILTTAWYLVEHLVREGI